MRTTLLLAAAGALASGAWGQTFATGAGSAASHVKMYHGSSGAEIQSYFAFPGAPIGVSVALGDVTGDGIPDVVAGAASSTGGHVKVFNGQTGALVHSYLAYVGYTGGITVAAGDVNGDGRADIVTGTTDSPNHVKVFDGSTLGLRASFFAYPGAPIGVRVATGDVDGDGRADIITGAASSATHVKVFRGTDLGLLRSYFAYSGVAAGVWVAGGDVDGDGLAEVVTGIDSLASHVKIFSGASGSEMASFFAFDSAPFGVRVAAGDVDGDGRADVVAGSEAGMPSLLRVYRGTNLGLMHSFSPYGSFAGGVHVAAPAHVLPEPAILAGLSAGLLALVRRRKKS
jgi:fibronectin-binding autotransporter adhesin